MHAVARKYAETKFMKLNAQEAPFFVTKLAVQVMTWTPISPRAPG